MSDPAEKMRVARRLAAMALGVDELPPDAEVEMGLDVEGTLHVHGSVVAKGYAPHITCKVKFEPPK